ncbi:TonB-dependent receptor [Tellurirhabdus bombi]|uniref:TonB-dependent receptor n=1 Tax=Tellurirhabdus bombi TaxID=2907205 RepID=UPI001F294DBD|nr:TonB-dependent receptor [Tellurirhabdus bombi]
MKFIYSLLFISLFLHPGGSVGQSTTGSIKGNVFNAKWVPLEGVAIRLLETGQGTLTDASGTFVFPNLPRGRYTIESSFLGYETQREPVRVGESSSKLVTFKLAEQAQLLSEVDVEGKRLRIAEELTEINGTYLNTGKRNEVVRLANIDANIAEKTPRQVFARIPGVFVYDMDGAGNQVNVATRGLDPHRSWEMNIRQNSVITNSDMYGYPASHYSPPMESIDRVELVRGTGSLQYGAQFGGMINYVTKSADTTRKVGFESINSVGSYGLLSTYNALGGRVGKLTYYAYYYKRASEGYRDNSRSQAESQFAHLEYRFSSRLKVQAELGRSTYVYQIPGPLTDSMFHQNPRQSTRSRNYFNPDIYVPSIKLDWQISDRTHLSWTTSAVLGARNSVQLDAFATVQDIINPQTGQYRGRQVDIDHFNSYTTELRLLHHYQIGRIGSTLAVGAQGITTDLHRQQQGKGTTGTDFDLSIDPSGWGRDLHLYTNNIALFAENQFRLTSRLSVSPGIRVENGLTKMRGTISYYPANDLPNNIAHRFALLGVSAQYRLTPELRLFGGWSQAYRPVIFKDIIPASVYERVDNNLKDAFGYNAELGISGQWKGVHLNVSVFDLLYRNRLGTLVNTDASGTSTVLRTNIGDSRNQGVEALIEASIVQTKALSVNVFTSTAYIDARYTNAQVATGNENRSVRGNRVESVPVWTSRNGLTLRHRTASLTILYSYVGKTFSDALNTPVATANGARGPVPAYGLLDLAATWRIGRQYSIRASLNNLANKQYFTKRPTFYPGPGVWSSDGRSAVVTVGIRI